MARKAAEIGCVTNTLASPWLIESARRNRVSASGPRISPIAAGPTGMSQLVVGHSIIPRLDAPPPHRAHAGGEID